MRLEQKYKGPCPIIKKVGRASYKINIPAWMKIHSVIHVSNLKLYHEDPADPTCNQPPRGAVKSNLPSSREPEEILTESEGAVGGRRRIEYLVK